MPHLHQLPNANYIGFTKDVLEHGAKIRKEMDMRDFNHLLKIRYFSRLGGLVGFLMSFIPNPLSIYLIAQNLIGNLLVGHHIGHGGYDIIKGLPKEYQSTNFGRGRRRFKDWLTWWDPRWWRHLHNHLHHTHTQDELDADILDPETFKCLPMPLRYLSFVFFCCTWQFSYYAPYMQREYYNLKAKKERTKPNPFVLAHLIDFRDPLVRELWGKYYLPYMGFRWVLLPLIFFPLGWRAVLCSSLSMILGEIVANIQGFLFIRSSHSAKDIPLFNTVVRGKVDYYARQVLGTSNYDGESDFEHFTSVWTCSQIEHHLWPTASMLKIRQARTLTRALCEKHGLAYTQQSIFKRILLMSDIYVGKAHQEMMDMTPLQTKRRDAVKKTKTVEDVISEESIDDMSESCSLTQLTTA